LSAKNPDDFWESTRTIGWHFNKSFLLPDRIIGKEIGICLSGNGEAPLFEKAGSFKDWNSHVALPCQGNDYLLFALSASFAGPLLKWLGVAGAGVHYDGDSTVCKSTAQCVAVSSWAQPNFMLLAYHDERTGMTSRLPL
jgi:putative DNA primase/helicase